MRPWAPVLVAHLFCFNPRICKRCDTDLGRITPVFTVSIHASVKDATFAMPPGEGSQSVSIHASVKDATRKDEILNNPSLVSIHASVKDATFDLSYTGDSHSVSIHASVKDATHVTIISIEITSFNPRICKRCDLCL